MYTGGNNVLFSFAKAQTMIPRAVGLRDDARLCLHSENLIMVTSGSDSMGVRQPLYSFYACNNDKCYVICELRTQQQIVHVSKTEHAIILYLHQHATTRLCRENMALPA